MCSRAKLYSKPRSPPTPRALFSLLRVPLLLPHAPLPPPLPPSRYRPERRVNHVARRSNELDVEKVQPTAFTLDLSKPGSQLACSLGRIL